MPLFLPFNLVSIRYSISLTTLTTSTTFDVRLVRVMECPSSCNFVIQSTTATSSSNVEKVLPPFNLPCITPYTWSFNNKLGIIKILIVVWMHIPSSTAHRNQASRLYFHKPIFVLFEAGGWPFMMSRKTMLTSSLCRTNGKDSHLYDGIPLDIERLAPTLMTPFESRTCKVSFYILIVTN